MKPVKNKYEKRMLKLENQRRANPCMKANKTNTKARFVGLTVNLETLRLYDADISKPVLTIYPRGGLIFYFLSAGTDRMLLSQGNVFFNSKGDMNILQEKIFGISTRVIIIPEDDIIKVKLRNRLLWKKIIIKTKKKRYSCITLPRTIILYDEHRLTRQEWPHFVRYMKDIMKRRKHQ